MSVAFFHKIGSAESGFSKWLADVLRFFPRMAQRMVLGHQKSPEINTIVNSIVRENTSNLWPAELVMVYTAAKAVTKIPGDFAEVGVYKGGSAKIIAEAKGSKILHLFDTFTGLPEGQDLDPKHMRQGMYASTLESVQAYLAEYPHIHFYPGKFPHADLPKGAYAFVHLDVDLYESTRAALAYFYPRLSHGGIILSHDYSTISGVQQAFDEFFADKPETVIELSTSQCFVVKA